MPRLTRIILVLVLTSLFTATVALAQAPSTSIRPRHLIGAASPDLLERLWSLLSQPWSKNGCQVDPNGRSQTAKNGCQVDPSGGYQTVKNGCEVDPNGRCI